MKRAVVVVILLGFYTSSGCRDDEASKQAGEKAAPAKSSEEKNAKSAPVSAPGTVKEQPARKVCAVDPDCDTGHLCIKGFCKKAPKTQSFSGPPATNKSIGGKGGRGGTAGDSGPDPMWKDKVKAPQTGTPGTTTKPEPSMGGKPIKLKPSDEESAETEVRERKPRPLKKKPKKLKASDGPDPMW